MNLNWQRLCTCLCKDLLEFYREVSEETEGITANSVVKDLLDQLGNLNNRLLDIKVMAESEPNIPPLPFTESDPLDGSIRSINLPVNQFICQIKKNLLELKDEIQDRKREDENRQKVCAWVQGAWSSLNWIAEVMYCLFKKATSTCATRSKKGAYQTGATIY